MCAYGKRASDSDRDDGERITEDILERFASDAAGDHCVEVGGDGGGVDGGAHPAQLTLSLGGAEGGGETREHAGRPDQADWGVSV